MSVVHLLLALLEAFGNGSGLLGLDGFVDLAVHARPLFGIPGDRMEGDERVREGEAGFRRRVGGHEGEGSGKARSCQRGGRPLLKEKDRWEAYSSVMKRVPTVLDP